MLIPDNQSKNFRQETPAVGQNNPAAFDFAPLEDLFHKGPHYSVTAYAQLLDDAMWWLVEYRDCLAAEFSIAENYWRLRELRDALSKMG